MKSTSEILANFTRAFTNLSNRYRSLQETAARLPQAEQELAEIKAAVENLTVQMDVLQ